MSLREKATSGAFWSAVDGFSQKFLVFFVQIVLARLIAPEQFGLLAMVAVFVQISSVLVEGGFGSAIIQSKDLSERDRCTVFYTNFGVALVISLALIFAAPAVARFYNAAELTDILRVLAVSLLIGAYTTVHAGIMNREMRFKRLFWVNQPATIGSAVIGVGMALLGYGVWALVAQQIAQKASRTVLIRFATKWSPSLIYSPDSLRRLASFGVHISMAEVLARLTQSVCVLVLGRLAVPAEVGYFQRARSFQLMPTQAFVMIVNRVLFPVMSGIQGEVKRFRAVFDKSLGPVFHVFAASMALLAAIATPLTVTLIGEVWLPSAEYLQYFCITGAVAPLAMMNDLALKAAGKSRAFLALSVIRALNQVVVLAFTARFGVLAIVIGIVTVTLFNCAIFMLFSGRWLELGFFWQIRRIFRPLMVALGVFLSVRLTFEAIVFPSPVEAMLGAGVGLFVLLTLQRAMLTPSDRSELERLFVRTKINRKFLRWLLKVPGGGFSCA